MLDLFRTKHKRDCKVGGLVAGMSIAKRPQTFALTSPGRGGYHLRRAGRLGLLGFKSM